MEIYQWVVFGPSGRLVYVHRRKGMISRGHHHIVKDSLISICSLGYDCNRAVRRPTAPASNIIHLKEGLARFNPAFRTFPPPLMLAYYQTLFVNKVKLNALTRLSVSQETRLPVFAENFPPSPWWSASRQLLCCRLLAKCFLWIRFSNLSVPAIEQCLEMYLHKRTRAETWPAAHRVSVHDENSTRGSSHQL